MKTCGDCELYETTECPIYHFEEFDPFEGKVEKYKREGYFKKEECLPRRHWRKAEERAEKAEKDLIELRAYVNPLPILNCTCEACVYLSRKQKEAGRCEECGIKHRPGENTLCSK